MSPCTEKMQVCRPKACTNIFVQKKCCTKILYSPKCKLETTKKQIQALNARLGQLDTTKKQIQVLNDVANSTIKTVHIKNSHKKRV